MASFTVTGTDTASKALVENNAGTDDTGTVTASGNLNVTTGAGITLDLSKAPAGNGVVITNAGTIQTQNGRTIDTGNTAIATGAKLTIKNSGTITNNVGANGNNDVIRINNDMVSGTFLFYNTGTISATGLSNDSIGVRLGKVYSASNIQINNGIDANGTINTNAKITTLGADAVRPGGVNPTGSTTAFGSSTVTNYGTIDAKSSTSTAAGAALTKVNGIDIGAGQASTVVNYGTIIGDESGLGADNTAGGASFAPTYYVTNNLGATITGRNGPAIAIGSSTSAGAAATTSTITNFGTITGQATGTGRGGTGTTVAAANGTGIFSAYAVTVVNGSTTNATAVIQGSGIKGAPAAAVQGSASTYYAINATSGSVTNYGAIRETVATGAGAAVNFSSTTVASTVTNYGSIVGANGAAIQMGGGNDTVNLFSGGTITGTIDGGAGTGDTLTLNAGASTNTGAFSGVANIEILKVNSGSWTLADAEAYSGGVTIAAGANLTIGDAGSTGAAIVDNGTLTYAKSGTFTKGEAITGIGTLVQAGSGTLVLTNSASSYSGGTIIQTGTLDVTTAGAAGTGAITFATGAQTLDIEQAALAGDGSYANTISSVGLGDTIDLRGIGSATSASYDATTKKLTVSGGAETVTLQLDASAPAAGYAYGVSSDGAGGTNVALDQIATVTDVTASPASGYAKAGDTISLTLTTSKAITITNPPPVLNLSNGATATYDAVNSTSTSLIFTTTVANGQDTSGVTITSVTNAADAQDAFHVPLDFSGATGHAAVGPMIDTMAPTVAITSVAGLTNQATQTISGTVDAAQGGSPDNGTVVSIYETVNGTNNLLGTATVANGTWSTSVNLSGNGNHTIFAQDTDAAGNTGTSGSVSYDLETTAPPVTIASAGGLTNKPMQTVLGHVDVGADPQAVGTTVTVIDTSNNNAVLGSGTVGNNGDFSVAVTLSGDGQHTLQAKDTDQAGNVGFATVTYNLDTTPPAAPSLSLANDTGISQTDAITSDPTVTYKPSAAGETLLYSIDGSQYGSTAPVLKTDGTDDGAHTISIQEQDAAGNVSTATSLSFTLDTKAPTTAPTIALANDTGASASDGITNDATITAAVGTAGDTLLYAADGSTTYSANVPVFTQDGAHTVSVVEQDAAGNVGPASNLSFTLDTKAPAVPSLALANDTGTSSGDNVTSDPSLNFSTSNSGDALLYKVDGATSYTSTAPSFATDGTADGAHTVSVQEVDRAGNVSAASSLTFTLDTKAPEVDFTSMGGTVNNAAQIVNGFAGVENAGTTVSIFEDGGTTAIGSALVKGDGYFSAAVNLGADGTHTLTAVDTDKAGNVGTTDETLTYTLDSTKPTFTPGNLVVSISGNGDGSGDYGDNEATPLVLRQITTDGTFVNQIVLPQTTTVVNGVTESVISAEYGSSSEGSLQLSVDGHSLVIAGYGVNAATYNAGGAAVYGNAALAQSTSIKGGQYTAVPRVIAEVNANGTIDTSTVLYNVYNGNNPRSVATIDGTSFYISGQGTKGDTTQGVFYVQDGASTATRIDRSTDTRTAVIYNGQLYISRDSKQNSGQPGQNSGGSSNISVYGPSLPTTTTTGTILQAINQSVTVTPANANTINGGSVGSRVNLDPENFFFANDTTLYVADGGIPKAGGVGDGGLQKWVFNGSQWTLQYTLSAGLGIIAPGATEGTTGLIGLTGRVNGDTVELYATNQTIGDTDQKYVFGISDSLGATVNSGQSFTTLVMAEPGTNIRGISFAPTPLTPTITLANDTGVSSTDTLTNDPTLSVTPARNGDTILYSIGGGVYSTRAPTFAGDGTYTVSVEEKDKGGALGPASSLTFTLDTTAPNRPVAATLDADSDSGRSATDAVTKVATPTFTGTAEVGATVSLYEGSTLVGTGTAGTDGTYSITSSTLADGVHVLNVKATDAAGNVSAASTGKRVVVDTTAPATPDAPSLTAASDSGLSATDGITKDATPAFTGQAEAGATVTLYDGTTSVGTTTAQQDGSYTVYASTLTDGTHSLSVTATDLAGNTSLASTPVSVTVDTDAPSTPAAPVLNAASDTGRSSTDGITKVATPTFSGTAEAGATVTLYDGTSTKIGTGIAASDGSFTIKASSLADGVHSIRVAATDAAGNASTLSAGTRIVVDTSAPTRPVAPTLTAASDTGRSSTDGITSDTTPTLVGATEAGATVSLYEGSKLIGSAMAGTNGAYSISASALGDGTHLLNVTATDAAGNVSGYSTGRRVIVDTTAPGAPSSFALTAASDTGLSQTDGITKDTTPTFTGTAEAGSTVTLFDGTTKVGTANANANGAFAITSSALAAGKHSLSVTATDGAGNIGVASSAIDVTVDNLRPAIPGTPTLDAASDTGVSATDGITKDNTPTFTGMAEAGTTVSLYEGKTLLGSTVAGGNGAYSIDSLQLADGTHLLNVTSTDAAGNVSGYSPGKRVVVDTRAPTTSITSKGGATTQASQTITGTGEAGTVVTLTDNGNVVGTVNVGSKGTWSSKVTLSSGANDLVATDTDKAGNAGTSQTVTYDYMAAAMARTASFAAPMTASSDAGLTHALFEAAFASGFAQSAATPMPAGADLPAALAANPATFGATAH